MDATRKRSGQYDELFGATSGKISDRTPVQTGTKITKPGVAFEKSGRYVPGTYGTKAHGEKRTTQQQQMGNDLMGAWLAASTKKTTEQLLAIAQANATETKPTPARMTTRHARLASLDAQK